MMNDCSCMAYVYRWLIWASRNAPTQAPETDRSTSEDERKVKMLRPAQAGPREVEAAAALSRPACQKRPAAVADTSATKIRKARL